MRIAQVAPLFESVPPRLYGGTERVVSYLTEALVRMGHEVTLFASGDSSTRARLAACVPRSLRLDGRSHLHLVPHLLEMEEVFRRHADFDVMHFHTDPVHFPFARRYPTPHVTTFHGRLDIPELAELMHEYQDLPVISISDAQRAPLPGARWQGTVHHGLPQDLLHFHPGPGRYLAFLGRISPEKRCDRAIEIARRLGQPLRIAAKVDAADKEYFVERIRPLLSHPLIEFVGEIGEREKDEFLGNATALLCPIDWPEPFGLVMIEAMACGTPVIAFRAGSVPEVVEPGVTGFVVDDMDMAARATLAAGQLDRRRCRHRFEQRFSAERMAREYVAVYARLARMDAADAAMEASYG
jgi:glycosyltransferase involved in cell wall biosynthesis